MPEEGKRRAMERAKLPPDGGMFPVKQTEQEQRRAAQALLKLLARDERRTEDGFVRWVDWRGRNECGDLYSLVEGKVKERLAKNAQIRESARKNEELKNG